MREKITLSLTLKVGGKEHAIPGGDVRALSLDLYLWGAYGEVELVMQAGEALQGKHKDELLDDFIKPDLGEITISLMPALLDTKTKPEDAKIATGGIILGREIREEVHAHGVEASAAITRRYKVTFADPATALWKQHFPCDLFTDKSFKDVIEAHKGDKITLKYELDAITSPAKQIFFHLDPGAGASFYDLVFGWVSGHGGAVAFDHDARTYAILNQKKQDGEPAKILGGDVREARWVFPAVPRHKPRVRNTSTEATRTEAADNANASGGLYHDRLLRTPIAKEVDDAVAAAKATPLLPLNELALDFRRFPTVSVTPGRLVDVSTKGGHSAARRLPTEAMRVIHTTIEARAVDQGPDRDFTDKATDFDLSIVTRLEQKTDKAKRFPALNAPRYPGYLEGKVVSEIGEDTDLTYEFQKDDETSVERYRVKIPLFEDQIIFAPYEPESGAGAIYFPLYKGERVLCALDLDKAKVVRLLDWRGEARVPMDGQGQHVFFGKSDKQSTSMLHDYQSDKPVLRVLRKNDKDTILFKMEEGKLTLKVEETK